MERIVIFAANSFLGRELVHYFTSHAYEVAVVTRPTKERFEQVIAHEFWDGENLGSWTKQLEQATILINLAGKSVNCRYTEHNKEQIFSSRLKSTRVIQQALDNLKNKPLKCWINAASATIYAHSENTPNTEFTGLIGSSFSVEVCQAWESAFFEGKSTGFRKIAIRTSIVLGNSGGVLPVLVKLAKRGLGGKMGSGKQQFSWIAIEDFCRAVQFLAENELSSGVYNLASPNPINNQNFQENIRKNYKIKWYINQPKWLLEVGARLIGTETELVLKSRYIYPERLISEGFQFKFPIVSEAIKPLSTLTI